MIGYLFVIAGIFLVDQWVKQYIEKNRKVNKKFPILDGKIIITKHHNKGAMLNFMEKKPNIIKGIACITLGYVIILLGQILSREKEYLIKFGISMVVGGGLSNVYDRLKYGYVIDYFIINYKKLKKVIFNIADICILIGAFLMLLGGFLNNKIFK